MYLHAELSLLAVEESKSVEEGGPVIHRATAIADKAAIAKIIDGTNGGFIVAYKRKVKEGLALLS